MLALMKGLMQMINWPFVSRKTYYDMVYKLEGLLCHATGNRYSKAGYSLADMERMVDDYTDEIVDEALEAYKFSEKRDKTENLLRCYGFSAEELIRFGTVVRALGIKEHEIESFLSNAERMWNILYEKFMKDVQESVEKSFLNTTADEFSVEKQWPKQNPYL